MDGPRPQEANCGIHRAMENQGITRVPVTLEACVHGGLFSCFRPYHKPNPFYEKLKSEHDEVMLQLKRLEEENTMASQKFSELTKETVFYR